MPEQFPEKHLDRLRRLVGGKPTASEFEALGANFEPHLHFVALLPSPVLPAAESENVQKYFVTMLEVLEPVRDGIAAYSLQGVMSRAPISDFSLKIQFSDPNTAGRVLKMLPGDRAGRVGSIIALKAVAESHSTEQREAGGSMFSRSKQQDQNPEQTSNATLPAAEAAAAPASAPQADPLRFLASAPPVPEAIVLQPLPPTPARAPSEGPERARKKLLIPEDITIRGDILGCEHLAIEGEANAAIERCGKLEILENGTFKGSAAVADAEISGYCEGTLIVRNTLHVRATGHIVGSVQYGSLVVEEGGRIEGEMKVPPKPHGQTSPELGTQPDNPLWLGLTTKVSSLASS